MAPRIICTIALTLFLACSSHTPKELELHDTIETTATNLRWSKETDGVATVTLHVSKPVVVLALPPGKYSTEQLQNLLSSSDAKQLLKGRSADPHSASIYVFGSDQSSGSYFRDHLLVPKSIGLWKQTDTPLEVMLKREGDNVHIVGLR